MKILITKNAVHFVCEMDFVCEMYINDMLSIKNQMDKSRFMNLIQRMYRSVNTVVKYVSGTHTLGSGNEILEIQ